MAEPAWKQFEVLVANIQCELSGESIVTHNDKILGRKSGVKRQIDVSIRGMVGQFDILIIIDCKDYAHPVDVKDIEDFLGLIDDVGAHQGAMVSAKGFTEATKTRGTNAGIAVYRLVDTDPHKWQAKVRAPVLCDFRGAKYSLTLNGTSTGPFTTPWDHREWRLYNSHGELLGIAPDLARGKRNSGEVADEVGEYSDVDFVGQPVQMENGHGSLNAVQLTASYLVERRLFFGWVNIEKIRGFEDEKDGSVTTREVTSGPFEFETIENEWQQLSSENEAPSKPMYRLQARDCYEA